MIFNQKQSDIFKRASMLLGCLLASVSLLSAQTTESLIAENPKSSIICNGEGIPTFEVVPNPNHPSVALFRYRWYEWTGTGWGLIQTAQYQGYSPTRAGRYYCEVIHDGVTETTPEVSLTINDTPFIPIDAIKAQSVCSGDNLTASVGQILTRGKDLLTYEWSFGGVPQSGFVTNNTVPPVTYNNVDVSLTLSSISLTVSNACGSASASALITIHQTPSKPIPMASDYCMGETAIPLSISESGAKWYNVASGGEPLQEAPVPVTSIAGNTQTWWVSRVFYNHADAVCESERVPVTVQIHAVPEAPKTERNFVLCLNDPGFTLQAEPTGSNINIQWYNDLMNPLSAAPQINPSIMGTHVYYVTQNSGRCESRMNDGQIIVRVRDRAQTDRINLPNNLDLCPYNSRTITATSQVQNPVFRWYRYDDKTGLIHENPTIETGVLTRDTVYYVTIQYSDLCESSYPQAVVIRVRDITLPEIAPQGWDLDRWNKVVPTDEGKCYATNVDVGRPEISDNCTDFDNLILYTDPSQPGVFPHRFSIGDTTLIWWVRDQAGNGARLLQNISVRDMEKPRGTCPGDIVVEINDNEISARVFYRLDYTDNCSAVKDSLALGKASGEDFPLGETRVRRLLIDEAGNTEICEFNVTVRHPYRPPVINLRIPKTSICPGELVEITPMINGGSGRFTYSWSRPFLWTEATMRDYPLSDTRYEVTISDGISPPQTLSAQITVLETRKVALALERYNNMDEIFEGEEVLVTATSGFESYRLLLNNEVIQASGLNNGVSFHAELGRFIVRVFATDFNGCVTQDQMDIFVDSRKLPNVFTPNFDGKNDLFLEGFDLEVYSRAGELLYKGVNGWDGTYKGKMMQQGTYLYTVRRIMNNGELRIIKSTVTIKQ